MRDEGHRVRFGHEAGWRPARDTNNERIDMCKFVHALPAGLARSCPTPDRAPHPELRVRRNFAICDLLRELCDDHRKAAEIGAGEIISPQLVMKIPFESWEAS